MTRSITAIFTLLIMISMPAGVAHSADAIEELKACARVTDRDARLVCFDDLGQRLLAEESAHEEPMPEEVAQPEAATPATATSAQPLPDDLGTSDQKTTNYSGTITSCKKGFYGDWYFYFDNGQVWKEVNNRNRRFKECNFDVTITKDRFGYKMRIDDSEKTIRVRRHQ